MDSGDHFFWACVWTCLRFLGATFRPVAVRVPWLEAMGRRIKLNNSARILRRKARLAARASGGYEEIGAVAHPLAAAHHSLEVEEFGTENKGTDDAPNSRRSERLQRQEEAKSEDELEREDEPDEAAAAKEREAPSERTSARGDEALHMEALAEAGAGAQPLWHPRISRRRSSSSPCTCSEEHGGAEPSRLHLVLSKPRAHDGGDGDGGGHNGESSSATIGGGTVEDMEDLGTSEAARPVAPDSRPRPGSPGNKFVHISPAFEAPAPALAPKAAVSAAAPTTAATDTGAVAATTHENEDNDVRRRRRRAAGIVDGNDAITASSEKDEAALAMAVATAEYEHEQQHARHLQISARGGEEGEREVAAVTMAVLAPSTTRVIPLHEVARHNTCEDCWIVAHGKVYDVTSYIFQHPGGAGAILRNAGSDATAHFDFHHKSSQKRWAALQIGVVSTGGGGGGSSESCIVC